MTTFRKQAHDRRGTLDPGQREALLLVGHDGLSAKEAAAVAGVAAAAFRMRLTRARRARERALHSDEAAMTGAQREEEA
jgi:RNA polymerase sigma-70 factor (ECF subfamily)